MIQMINEVVKRDLELELQRLEQHALLKVH
jgi:hypothetical protein